MHDAEALEKWFFIPNPNPDAAIRLFCFPYAGGGGSVFFNWPKYLDKNIEVVAVRMPGREGRFKEKPFHNTRDAVLELIQMIPFMLDRPFAFFGHSLGTRISFELARELRKRGYPEPVYFFMSAGRAPHLPVNDRFLYQLPDDQFIEKIKAYNGLPKIISENSELMNLFIPVLKADIEIFKAYEYKEDKAFCAPIVVFGGMQDPIESPKGLEDWQMHTNGEFNIYLFPGGHFFIKDHVREVLELISNSLLAYL